MTPSILLVRPLNNLRRARYLIIRGHVSLIREAQWLSIRSPETAIPLERVPHEVDAERDAEVGDGYPDAPLVAGRPDHVVRTADVELAVDDLGLVPVRETPGDGLVRQWPRRPQLHAPGYGSRVAFRAGAGNGTLGFGACHGVGQLLGRLVPQAAEVTRYMALEREMIPSADARFVRGNEPLEIIRPLEGFQGQSVTIPVEVPVHDEMRVRK